MFFANVGTQYIAVIAIAINNNRCFSFALPVLIKLKIVVIKARARINLIEFVMPLPNCEKKGINIKPALKEPKMAPIVFQYEITAILEPTGSFFSFVISDAL